MTYRIPPTIVAHLENWGLKVVEYDGWRGRGHGTFPAAPQVIVCHHTGTPDSRKGDYPTQDVVINGRSDLKGPLCNFGLGRSGTVYLVADGVAWHAGKGAWDGLSVGNEHSLGIEAESAGGGHWTDQQRKAYPLLCAALCDFFGIPAKRVCAHRESALPKGRKDDPVGIDMPSFRASVAQLVTDHHAPKQTIKNVRKEPRMIVRFAGHPEVWEVVGSHLEHVTSDAYHARGLTDADVRDLPATHSLAKLPRQ